MFPPADCKPPHFYQGFVPCGDTGDGCRLASSATNHGYGVDRAMPRTPVSEASINEDRNACRGEDDVQTSGQRSTTKPVSESAAVGPGSELDLRPGMLGGNTAHVGLNQIVQSRRPSINRPAHRLTTLHPLYSQTPVLTISSGALHTQRPVAPMQYNQCGRRSQRGQNVSMTGRSPCSSTDQHTPFPY